MERTFDRRLLIGIALIVVMLVTDAGLDYYNTFELREDAVRVGRAHAVLEALEDVASTMKDAETGERGYILTGNVTYREPYDAAVKAIDGRVERLKTLTADDPGHRARLP